MTGSSSTTATSSSENASMASTNITDASFKETARASGTYTVRFKNPAPLGYRAGSIQDPVIVDSDADGDFESDKFDAAPIVAQWIAMRLEKSFMANVALPDAEAHTNVGLRAPVLKRRSRFVSLHDNLVQKGNIHKRPNVPFGPTGGTTWLLAPQAELQPLQPAKCQSMGALTPLGDPSNGNRGSPTVEQVAQELRHASGSVRWWFNDGHGKFVSRVQNSPPSRRTARKATPVKTPREPTHLLIVHPGRNPTHVVILDSP
ncbi:MAG: hypothetical protein Q9166_005778 [cf. Caloplaca sp. 2 TL-2023]